MLFAQASGDITAWVTTAINLGALGILGFYFLKVEPAVRRADHIHRMDELRLIAKVFSDNKEAYDAIEKTLTEQITELRKQGACKWQP